MRICIFGKHPAAKGGFEGVMSFYESYWLSNFGHNVDLVMPFASRQEYFDLLRDHGVNDLNSFVKFNSNFNVLPIFKGERFPAMYDFGIWQSYTPWEHEEFLPRFRESCLFTTKNYPKFIPNENFREDQKVMNQFKAFDLVSVALLDDFNIIKNDTEFYEQYRYNVCYTPRGADPRILNPSKKNLRPMIGIDAPTGRDIRSVKHIIESLRIVKEKIPDLEIVSLNRRYDILNSVKIPHGNFLKFYDNFINPIWIYMVINYEYSPSHVKARVQKENPKWSKKGIYEIQNIEVQMAGGCIVAHSDNIIDELYLKNKTGFNFDDYEDYENIAELIMKLIDNHERIKKDSREFAYNNFNWEYCIKRWEEAMIKMVENKSGKKRG